MAITINGSGTITGVSAGGLPDGSITADDLATSLDLTGKTVTLPSGTGGKLLQVVQEIRTANTTITSTSFVDTGLSASITPSSTSSKILVMVSSPYYIYDSSGTRARGGIRIVRDSTTVYSDDVDSASNVLGLDFESTNLSQAFYRGGRYDMKYVDSPSSTSALTYKLQGAVVSGDILRFPLEMTISEAGSVLILMEIGG